MPGVDSSLPTYFHLVYGTILVAHVRADSVCEQTWEGRYEIVLSGDGVLERRLTQFLAYSRDFWRRFHSESEQNPAMLYEIDQYNDLINSELWCMKSLDGSLSHQLAQAPMFLEDGHLSWMYK